MGLPARAARAPYAEHFVNCRVPPKRGDSVPVWGSLWDFSFKENTFQTTQQNILGGPSLSQG